MRTLSSGSSRGFFFAPFFAENEERADHPAGPRLFGVKANEVRWDGQSPTQAAACGRPRLDNLERGGAGRCSPRRARTRRRTDGLRTAARARRWAPLGLQDLRWPPVLVSRPG